MSTDEQNLMTRTTMTVVVAIFIALVIDGMSLQLLSLSMPVLMKEFSINKTMAGLIGTYFIMGMGIGGFISGWLADRIGRVKVTLYSLFFFIAVNIVLVSSQSYMQFAIYSLLLGVSVAATYSIGTLIAAEYVPTSKRTTVLGTLQAGWSIGYIVAALASSYILPNLGWRMFFLIPIVPSIITIILLSKVKEPKSFAAAQMGINKKSPGVWNELMGNKKTRTIFILWAVSVTALQCGYYGVTTWLPSYVVKELGVDLKSMGFYVAGTYSAMIFGKILAGILADKFGRRVIWVTTGITTALALPLIMTFVTISSVTYLFPIFGFFYGAPYAILSTYLSESFPTKVRGTAVASSTALGRAGSMLAPAFIGIIAEQYSIAIGIASLGIVYGLASIIPGIFIREKMYDPQSTD